MQWSTCKTMCLNIRTFVNPRYQRLCCQPQNNRKYRLETLGFKHVLKEISIVNILKQLRVLKAAAKQSMSKHDWKLLNNNHAMMAYSELDSDIETRNDAKAEPKPGAKDIHAR